MSDTTRLRTKMFEEHRIANKPPGAAPGTWIIKSRTVPIDEAINHWLTETGNILVGCSPPGIHVQWMDKEMTTRAIIVAVMVNYQEGPHERTVTVPFAESTPTPADPDSPAAAATPSGSGPFADIGGSSVLG